MLFMRHGQSVFNAMLEEQGFDPGIPDPPLTPKGRAQVERAAKQMKKGSIDHILSSPYTRAIQTALIVAAHHDVPVQIEPLAGERRLYSCDVGRVRTDLEQDFPDLDFSMVPDDIWWTPFPESGPVFQVRLDQFRAQWADTEGRQKILVTSHMYFISTLTGAYPMNAEWVSYRL